MRPQENAALVRLMFNRRVVEDDNNIGGIFEECIFHHLDITGVYFTRPMLDANATLWGPAPYTWEAATSPVKGNRLLIAFVTVPSGGLRPWALGWSAT